MFVALPRKVDTMLGRANLARVEPNLSGSLSSGKGISVCCALSVETVLCLRNSVHQQPHAAAGHEHGKQTNEFAAGNRYPALDIVKCSKSAPWSKKLFHVASTSTSDTMHQHCKKKNILLSFDEQGSFTNFCVLSFISQFGGNLYGSRGIWVAYSLICRQNKEDTKRISYVHNRELVKTSTI
jgi:hypothetical protein